MEGLSSAEAKHRLELFGTNEIKNVRNSWVRIFVRQIASPLTYLLALAATISAFTGDFSDSAIIFVIILINTVLGFTQEFRANKIYENLKSFLTSEVVVVRDNKEIKIDRRFIVPGDLIILRLGDIVSADAIIRKQTNLIVDESALTGESQSVYKQSTTEKYDINTQSDYLLYSGSAIIKGEVYAEVYATGKHSKFGEIAEVSLHTRKKSEYEENINSLSKWFTIISLVSILIIFWAHLILDKHTSFVELLLFTIAIAITIIPEALPVITTLALVHSANILSRKSVLVKKLSAIQDLGNIDIICTDKTGTITENKLEILDFITSDSDVETHCNASLLFKDTIILSKDSTDPIDVSLFNYVQTRCNAFELKDELFEDMPFDPILRLSGRKFENYTIIKGAPEHIVETYSSNSEEILREIKEKTKSELRCISIAYIDNHDNSNSKYLGTYFFDDEIKKETAEAIKLAERQNLLFKVITGDSLEVAIHVGKESGLLKDETHAILASSLSFDNPEKLIKEVEHYVIFARCDPIQKFNIIKSLQTKYSVGYLGDGINDAPSLQEANVSMVVDTASDIAKSNADIILLTKNLRVIVDGVVQGRKAFVNIDKYLKHTVSSNFGNLYTVGVISLFLNFLPLLPIQILLNNLLSDIPCLALATDNVEHHETRKPMHHTIRDTILFSIVLGLISSVFDIIFFIWAYGNTETYVQSMAFFIGTITELFIIFSMRTRRFIFKGSFPSKRLFILVSVSLIISFVIAIFGFNTIKADPIQFRDITILVLITIAYFATSELVKIIFYTILHKVQLKNIQPTVINQ